MVASPQAHDAHGPPLAPPAAGAQPLLPQHPPVQPGIERLAAVRLAAGRVAPALEPDGQGGLLARWWPLPAPEDRPWFEALLSDEAPASQQALAEALAEAWLTALAADDPHLPDGLSPTPAAEAAPSLALVAAWVGQAVASGGSSCCSGPPPIPACCSPWPTSGPAAPRSPPRPSRRCCANWGCSPAWLPSWPRYQRVAHSCGGNVVELAGRERRRGGHRCP